MRQRYFKGLRKHTEGTIFSHPRRSLIFNGGGLKKNEVVGLMMKMKRGAAWFGSVGEPAWGATAGKYINK